MSDLFEETKTMQTRSIECEEDETNRWSQFLEKKKNGGDYESFKNIVGWSLTHSIIAEGFCAPRIKSRMPRVIDRIDFEHFKLLELADYVANCMPCSTRLASRLFLAAV